MFWGTGVLAPLLGWTPASSSTLIRSEGRLRAIRVNLPRLCSRLVLSWHVGSQNHLQSVYFCCGPHQLQWSWLCFGRYSGEYETGGLFFSASCTANAHLIKFNHWWYSKQPLEYKENKNTPRKLIRHVLTSPEWLAKMDRISAFFGPCIPDLRERPTIYIYTQSTV